MTPSMNIQAWEKHVPKPRQNHPETSPSPSWKRTDQFGRRHWIETMDGFFVMQTEFDPGCPESCAPLFTSDLATAQARADDHIHSMEGQGPPIEDP